MAYTRSLYVLSELSSRSPLFHIRCLYGDASEWVEKSYIYASIDRIEAEESINSILHLTFLSVDTVDVRTSSAHFTIRFRLFIDRLPPIEDELRHRFSRTSMQIRPSMLLVVV